MRKASILGVGLAMVVAALTGAKAETRTNLSHLHPGNESRPPIGWVMFWQAQPLECQPVRSTTKAITLTSASWAELVDVNLRMNRSIEPLTDQEQFGVPERWTYAKTGKGDCEDYVLEKKRELVRRGWPASALLITVVLDKDGGGHAVLTVITDRGEFVLDNQTDRILSWSESGLTFIKRQSASNPNHWLDLGRILGRPEVVTATIR